VKLSGPPGTALLFLGAVIVIFSRSFGNYFVCDDFEFLGRIDLHNAAKYFGQSWGYGNEYRPLLVYTYAVDGAISGRNPFEYHLVNTALHGINALLAALIFRYLGLQATAVLLTACIFVLNPVTHESVLWIAGRPVILSTAFVLFSIWASLRAVTSNSAVLWWIAAYLSFIASLLTYEGAVVLPALLLVAHCARIPREGVAHWRMHAFGLFLLVISYLVAWNLFFHFKITRFPVENSPLRGMLEIWTAMRHSLHGSSRTLPAALYGVLLVTLIRTKTGRRLFLVAGLWFLCAYLPFFIVHGYADRFAYLSSAASSAILGSAVVSVYSRWKAFGGVTGIALVVFFAFGMEGRIMVWKRAGEIARRIPQEIKQLHPHLPPDATVILVNVPNTYRDAYVFLAGVERAVMLQYPDTPLRVFRRPWKAAPKPVFMMDCSAEHVRDVQHPMY
jgi:hypothetical protein